MGMFHWVSLCSNTLNSKSLHTSYFFHFCSFTETSKEKKTKVDPKLVFPLKLWLLSWLPRERKRWNSKTGLPRSDDKEDWVQLGERKQPGSPEEVTHPVNAQFFSIRFPHYLGTWNRLDLVTVPLTTISQKSERYTRHQNRTIGIYVNTSCIFHNLEVLFILNGPIIKFCQLKDHKDSSLSHCP